MSFKWNPSQRDHSDHSFILQGNELVATSIGITANRTMLSCIMNMDAQDFKYYKSQTEILEAMSNTFKKNVQWAFRQIQKHTHYHKDYTNTVFLPDALNHGNYSALSKFLQKLKTNRVGAYVKLSLQQSKGYFLKAATLLKPATKIIRERMRYGFVSLKKHMMDQIQNDQKKLILSEIDKISSIDNKESQYSEKAVKNPKNNVINISYTLVKLNPEKITQITNRKESLGKSRRSMNTSRQRSSYIQQINIDDLLAESYQKNYQFQNVDTSRMSNTRVKDLCKG